MPISVKFFPTLVNYTKSHQTEYEAPWRPGLTVQGIIDAEELGEEHIDAIAVLVNLVQGHSETELQDGDRVEFLVSLCSYTTGLRS